MKTSSSISIFARLVAVGVLCACGGLLNAASSNSSIVSGSRTRTFDVHLPASYASATTAPLLLVFHGAGGSGRDAERATGLSALSDQYGFIVVYPDAAADSRGTWALGCNRCTWADAANIDDYRFARDLVDSLAQRYRVDRERVFATGVSLGGSFAYDLACHEPSLLAGTAVVASLPSVEELPLCRAPTRPLRFIAAIGDRDPNVPWDGGTGGSGATYRGAEATAADWASRNQCAAVPTRRELADANGDGQLVRVLEYNNCPAGGFVRFFKVGGVGHTWPRSQEFDTSAELARSFFGVLTS